MVNKEIVVRTVVQKPSTNKGGNKKRKNNRRKNRPLSSLMPTTGDSSSAVRYSLESTLGGVDHPKAREFLTALMAPDVFGPIRIPRSGASQRTGLAIDRTRANIVGAAGQVSGLRLTAPFNTAGVGSYTNIAALTPAALLAVAPGSAPGSQFPALANIGDINLVAQSIVISYFGNPLTVRGEMIIGTTGNFDLTASSYNALSFYPGFVRLPIAEVINKPIRVFGRKVSPAANNFVGVSSSVEDYEYPMVLQTGLPVGEFLSVEITRTYEYRSSIADATVVPYEKSTSSFMEDLAMFNDAEATISNIAIPASEAWSPILESVATETFGEGVGAAVPHFITGATSLLSLYMARNAARNRVALPNV